jgi:HEAT repeats
MDRDSRARIGWSRVCVLVVLAITALAAPARADKIDDLIGNLDDSSDRVRISAVLALTNQQSPRAINALVKRLADTGEKKNIRGLSASALGSIIQNGNPNAAQKKTALDALQKAKNDPEPFVAAKAEAALSQLGSSGPSTTSFSGPAAGVYVNVGPLSAKTGSADDPKYRAAMEKSAKSAFAKTQSSWVQTWAGGGVPTKTQLQQKKFAGFYIDGTLGTLTVTKSGNTATISCKVSMLLADFPDKALIGMPSGSANVQGGASQRDVDLSINDCVEGVIENIVKQKIIPAIKTKI